MFFLKQDLHKMFLDKHLNINSLLHDSHFLAISFIEKNKKKMLYNQLLQIFTYNIIDLKLFSHQQ